MSRNYKRKSQEKAKITMVVKPVAGNANPRHKKPSREERRLAARIADHAQGCTSREGKVEMRWDTGGYHRPGSLQRG